MARRARRISSSGIYHVMLRGINRQTIFEDEADCRRFLSILRKCKENDPYILHAWCLMGNHVHLVLQTDKIGELMKKIGVSYSYYYNTKYERVGYVFQDRYRSEPIETTASLLRVVRYVHLNPVKANLSRFAETYRWSSMREYCASKASFAKTKPLTDMETMIEISGGLGAMISFTYEGNEDTFIEMNLQEKILRITDDQARAIMKRETGCSCSCDVQCLQKADRAKLFRTLAENKIPVWQISRITGYSRTIIYNAIK